MQKGHFVVIENYSTVNKQGRRGLVYMLMGCQGTLCAEDTE